MSRRYFRRLAAGIFRFGRSADGVAAVEFGFIAPIMLLMLIGTIEISRAVTIDRRFGLATAMIADLITREEEMDSANLNKIYEIVEHVMGSYDNGSMKVSVIPVMANPDDATETKVYAGTTNRPALNGGVDDPAQCADYAMTADLVDAGSTVIVVKSSFDFEPILLGYVMGAVSWSDTAVLSPRGAPVKFDGDELPDCFD